MTSRRVIIAIMISFPLMVCAQHRGSDYKRDGQRVYYHHELIANADGSSFVELGHGYAKDKHHVYMHGKVLDHVDPSTFRLKSPSHGSFHADKEKGRYQKSRSKVYFNGKDIDASTLTFEELGDGYAKDAFTVFYLGRKIDGASVTSFKLLGDGYAKDAFTVYFLGKKMDDASVTSFKLLGDGYAEDAFNSYYWGKRL